MSFKYRVWVTQAENSKYTTGYEAFLFLLHTLHRVFGDIMSCSCSVDHCSDNKGQCETHFSSVGLLKHRRAFMFAICIFYKLYSMKKLVFNIVYGKKYWLASEHLHLKQRFFHKVTFSWQKCLLDWLYLLCVSCYNTVNINNFDY